MAIAVASQLVFSGQWCNLLDDSDLARYDTRVRALASDDLVSWVHSARSTKTVFGADPHHPGPTSHLA
jgi:hypothetical protein